MKCTLAALVLLCVTLTTVHPQDAQRTAWAEQSARVRRLACGPPREQIVLLSELELTMQTSEVYSPSATVLHRCARSNVCCGVGFTWGPIDVQQVQLVFRVRDLVSAESNRLRTVSAANHTRCACLRVESAAVVA